METYYKIIVYTYPLKINRHYFLCYGRGNLVSRAFTWSLCQDSVFHIMLDLMNRNHQHQNSKLIIFYHIIISICILFSIRKPYTTWRLKDRKLELGLDFIKYIFAVQNETLKFAEFSVVMLLSLRISGYSKCCIPIFLCRTPNFTHFEVKN